MKVRSVTLVLLALAVLLSRTAGLHFHIEDAHHHVGAEHTHESPSSVPGLFAELEDEHLLDHLAGAEDVDSSAMPAGAAFKFTSLLAIVSFIGIALLLLPSLLPVRPARAPLRPPRLRGPAALLPPSQGPPLAA